MCDTLCMLGEATVRGLYRLYIILLALASCEAMYDSSLHVVIVVPRVAPIGITLSGVKRTTPIDFQGQGSKVKVTRKTLLLNLVNTIQTETLQLGPSNLVHILLMTRG